MIRHFTASAGRLVRAQGLAMLALVLLISGGTAAYAATVAKNSVVSSSIKNGQVKTPDLANGAVTSPKLGLNAVNGDHVADDSLKGTDVDESSLGVVPNASSLGGAPASSYLRGNVYKKESALAAGTALGDGTFVLGIQCDPGDILLSGGPANVSGTSDMVESFPSPGTTNGWSARIHKNAAADNFSVVLLCLNTA